MAMTRKPPKPVPLPPPPRVVESEPPLIGCAFWCVVGLYVAMIAGALVMTGWVLVKP